MSTLLVSLLVIAIPFHSSTKTNDLTINLNIDESQKGNNYEITSNIEGQENDYNGKDFQLSPGQENDYNGKDFQLSPDCGGGISCCFDGFTKGDNKGGQEFFIQTNDYLTNCEQSCKKKYPSKTVGISESLVQTYKSGNGKDKNKCWCEFGPPKLDTSNENYQTCMFRSCGGGIICCSEGLYTTGDNDGREEHFIQPHEYLTNCEISCKTLFPTKTDGISESVVQTYTSGSGINMNKCWCEFGPPKLDSSNTNYQTCMLPNCGGGISCCDHGFSTGDNKGAGGESFIAEHQYLTNCEESCKNLYPSKTTGMTESLLEAYTSGSGKHKNKCWCEFGPPKLDPSNTEFRTCMFFKADPNPMQSRSCDGGISCCSEGFTTGDNIGDGKKDGEAFIQPNQYSTNCQISCENLHPRKTVGITESLVQKYSSGKGTNRNKCWCEFGPPKLNPSKTNYQTCMLPKHTGIKEIILVGKKQGASNPEEQCPYPYFLIKMESKMIRRKKNELKKRETYPEDTGLTGIRGTCGNYDTNPSHFLKKGSWDIVGSTCPMGSYINKVRIRTDPDKGVINGVEFQCNDEEQNVYKDEEMDRLKGTWGPWEGCGPNSAVIGFPTMTDPKLGLMVKARCATIQTREKDETCTPEELELTQGYQLPKTGPNPGLRADWNDWPWVVSIAAYGDNWVRKCGGTLIHCQYVLTALHCILDFTHLAPVHPSKISVFVGTATLWDGRKVEAEKVFYPDLDYGRTVELLWEKTPKHDIALIKLLEELDPEEYPPILLTETAMPTMNYQLDLNGNVAGFGLIDYNAKDNKQVNPTFLQETSGLLFNSPCPPDSAGDMDLTNHICSQATDKDATCAGDSGGPYMSSEEDSNSMTGRRKWFLRGILSTAAHCNISWSGPHGIMMDVYKYLPFIYSNMELTSN